MPEGYLSAAIWLIAVVLWWSGWRGEMAGRMPHAVVTALLVAWPLTVRLKLPLPLPFGLRVEANGAGLLTLACFLIVAARLETIGRMTASASGLLIASVVLFLDKLVQLSPAWLPLDPGLYIAVAASIAAATLMRSAEEQAVALTIAWSLVNVVHHGLFFQRQLTVLLHLDWSDSWWISLAAARLWSVSTGYVYRLWREFAIKGGQRS